MNGSAYENQYFMSLIFKYSGVCVCVCVRASSFDLIKSHALYVFLIIPKKSSDITPKHLYVLTSVNENMLTESS
jgi:hypothetical protein